MDDRRAIWLLVLGGLAFLIAVAGLLIAINAKNSSTSDEDLANSVKAEISKQVPQLQTALSAQSRAVTRGLRQAARARALIKGAQVVDRNDLNKVSAQVNKLSSQVKALQGDVDKLTNDVNSVTNNENRTRDTVANLTKRVDQLQAELANKKNK